MSTRNLPMGVKLHQNPSAQNVLRKGEIFNMDPLNGSLRRDNSGAVCSVLIHWYKMVNKQTNRVQNGNRGHSNLEHRIHHQNLSYLSVVLTSINSILCISSRKQTEHLTPWRDALKIGRLGVYSSPEVELRPGGNTCCWQWSSGPQMPL